MSTGNPQSPESQAEADEGVQNEQIPPRETWMQTQSKVRRGQRIQDVLRHPESTPAAHAQATVGRNQEWVRRALSGLFSRTGGIGAFLGTAVAPGLGTAIGWIGAPAGHALYKKLKGGSEQPSNTPPPPAAHH